MFTASEILQTLEFEPRRSIKPITSGRPRPIDRCVLRHEVTRSFKCPAG